MPFCERWQVTEFALPGSVLREDFGPGSDIDVLRRFAPKAVFGAVRDILAGEGEQELVEGPSLAFGPFDENGIGAAGIGEMQALEHDGELDGHGLGRRGGGPMALT